MKDLLASDSWLLKACIYHKASKQGDIFKKALYEAGQL